MADLTYHYPELLPLPTSTTFSPQTLQAVGDYYSVIRQAEEDAIITKVSGYCDIVTGTVGTMRVGIQSINTAFSTTVTFTAASTSCNGTFTGGTALVVGTPVVFSNSGGALPAAITAGTTYYVVSTSSTIITVAATYGGTAITFATAGTGTHTLSTLSGIPSGTWIAFQDAVVGSSGSGSFTNFSTFNVTLTSGNVSTTNLTRGQVYAIVMQAQTGTWSGAASFRTWTDVGQTGSMATAFPYTYGIANGATVGKSTSSVTHLLAAGSSTKWYGITFTSSNIASFNSGATPNEYGNVFVLPTGSCTSFKVSGIHIPIGLTNSATTTYNLTLYDSANTVLQQTSFNNRDTFSQTTIILRTYFFTGTLATLTPGTTYRIALSATNASAGFGSFNALNFGVNQQSGLVGTGGSYYQTTRTGSGAWTDTTTAAVGMKVIIQDMTASGGGGVTIDIPIGMTGGMRG
jgi:hypothetical protein